MPADKSSCQGAGRESSAAGRGVVQLPGRGRSKSGNCGWLSRFRGAVWLGYLTLACAAASADETAAEGPANASRAGSPSSRPAVFRSRHFVVHTDLSPARAKDLVGRLEKTLDRAVRYWGRESRRQIKCYVVDDLTKWSSLDLPHRLGRVFIGGVTGATVGNTVGEGRNSYNLATVYASSLPGVAEHEIVHAYCSQNYGVTGPYWYKEGMAEMAARRCGRASGVICSPAQIQILRASPTITLEEVVGAGATADRIAKSLSAMLSDPKNRRRQIPLDDWTKEDTDNVRLVRHDNLRCWLLCYMLHNSRGYRERFQSLGAAYLAGQDGFQDLFGPMRREIAFDYQFLLERVDIGYRVDLCSWDWGTRFKSLGDQPSMVARVSAARGYQASGLRLTAGQSYVYRASGTWSTAGGEAAMDADGDTDGKGRLLGAIMDDFQLGEPFQLGVAGAFTSRRGGDLYLRCGDAWTELEDNGGSVQVSFRHQQ